MNCNHNVRYLTLDLQLQSIKVSSENEILSGFRKISIKLKEILELTQNSDSRYERKENEKKLVFNQLNLKLQALEAILSQIDLSFPAPKQTERNGRYKNSEIPQYKELLAKLFVSRQRYLKQLAYFSELIRLDLSRYSHLHRYLSISSIVYI